MITIMDARKMSKTRIELELGKHVEELEKLGMDHEKACEFLSSVMNLGIAVQEKLDKNQK